MFINLVLISSGFTKQHIWWTYDSSSVNAWDRFLYHFRHFSSNIRMMFPQNQSSLTSFYSCVCLFVLIWSYIFYKCVLLSLKTTPPPLQATKNANTQPNRNLGDAGRRWKMLWDINVSRMTMMFCVNQNIFCQLGWYIEAITYWSIYIPKVSADNCTEIQQEVSWVSTLTLICISLSPHKWVSLSQILVGDWAMELKIGRDQ